MTWKTVVTKDAVHVIPTSDWHPHILKPCCECTPVIEHADPKDGMRYAKPHVIHRDEFDRLKKDAEEELPNG